MEPERRIEKWLRAFAKKRHEQAGEPMELHLATRQRLQREIARRAEEKNRGGFLSRFFFVLRPRLVFAVCFIALAVGGWFLIPKSTAPPATLSMNTLDARKMTREETAPAATPPPVANVPVAGEDKKLQEKTLPPVATAPPPARPTVATLKRETVPAPSEPTKQTDRGQYDLANKEVTVSTAASTPVAPAPASNMTFAFKNVSAADSLAVAGTANKDADGVLRSVAIPPASNFGISTSTFAANQRALRSDVTLQPGSALASSATFDDAQKTASAAPAPITSQVFNRLETTAARRRTAGVSGTPAPVLVSFRVEQTGNTMKVVDADGSIYTGSVQMAQQQPPAADFALTAPKTAPATAATPAANRTVAKAPAPQNYFFRVAGTNRNLNQNIVFSGNFVPLTNDQFAGYTVGTRAFGGAAGRGAGGGGGGGGGGSPISGIGASSPTSGLPVETPLFNSQINGTIVIGDQNAVDMTAIPAH